MRKVTILGSTGSIGVQALDVMARHPDRFRIVSLTAHSNSELLRQQCLRLQPERAVLSEPEAARTLQHQLRAQGVATEVLCGADALVTVAQDASCDTVLAAIVGAAGLMPTLAAVKQGKRVLLANKEALVMAGDLFAATALHHQADIIPVDSEHNALFQCMPEGYRCLQKAPVQSIVLTASGGPLRLTPLDQLPQVTPEQAIKHPNWQMGQKISVDSATMMNKGLELIEAYYLFGLPLAQIEVLLHPQSVVHSMVRYVDGSVLAQLGQPDMRTALAHALAWPQRIFSGVDWLDLVGSSPLEFDVVDEVRYPCMTLAKQALHTGGTAMTILNAANEIAVAQFLQRGLRFTDIATVIDHTLNKLTITVADSVETVQNADLLAREEARNFAGVMQNTQV